MKTNAELIATIDKMTNRMFSLRARLHEEHSARLASDPIYRGKHDARTCPVCILLADISAEVW
jgi:hypothetical protein